MLFIIFRLLYREKKKIGLFIRTDPVFCRARIRLLYKSPNRTRFRDFGDDFFSSLGPLFFFNLDPELALNVRF